jgi:hypothetical protein
MSIIDDAEIAIANSELKMRIKANREKRERATDLESFGSEFAAYFYKKMSEFTDEDHPTDVKMDRAYHQKKLAQSVRFATMLNCVHEAIDLRPCIMDALRDLSPTHDATRPNKSCVVCARFQGKKLEAGDHGYKEDGGHLLVCPRCVLHLRKTGAPNTGEEEPCAHCGFVHAWIPDAVYGTQVARLADSLSSGMHGYTPLGVFFAAEALRMFNVEPELGYKILPFYTNAYVGLVPTQFKPIKLPQPDGDEARAIALMAMVTYHEYFPLCYTSEMPMYDSRNVRRK